MKQIGGIEFDGDRITFTFVDPDSDIRNKGLVMATHQLVVLRSAAYSDEIAALDDAAQELLEDAWEDYQTTDAVTPVPPADLDDPDGDDE